ncbi:butyrophilin subfamily 2 member A1-like [Sardina pilchardus]|uniref:butyrophilin subfamily 2 member A1-like n=1 Tax=Sardina pilchardus TaxID=27697 RepID=UPI002E0FE887
MDGIYPISVVIFCRMKTLVSLLTILAVATQGFIVQGPSAPLHAAVGGSIVLPCSVEPPLPLEGLEVQWSHGYYGAMVNLFQQGEERPESQSVYFRGKVHFFTEEFAHGNYSLLLTKLNPSHNGSYRCQVFSHDRKNETNMAILELGEVSLQTVFAMMFGGLGAVVALLTSTPFQHYLYGKGAKQTTTLITKTIYDTITSISQ